MPAEMPPKTLAGLTLAFEMMGRAYEALALLYEMRHPGEYAAQSGELKAFIAHNFRQVERALTEGEPGSEAFREAILAVREVFDRVDAEVRVSRVTKIVERS